MKLSDRQIDLYSRQILLRELGGVGQRRLLAASCLLAGSGPALETAATYLVGAGVGAVDLLALPAAATGPARGRLSGFAALAERGPDARLRPRAAVEALDLGAFDVLLLSPRRRGADDAPLWSAAGTPRVGAIRIDIRDAGDAALVLVPPASGVCFACAVPAPARAEAPEAAAPGEAELVACFAGAMAALAACRWLAGIESDAAPRALGLGPGTPVWLEIEVVRLPVCPRGCGGSGG